MSPLDKALDYCQNHTSPVNDILAELERETHLRTLSPQMLSGAYQGQLLRFFSLMIRPRRVLEIGTFTGYATLCMAEGLADDGLLHTIEINDELSPIIQKYLRKAGLEKRVQLHLGDAAHIIPRLDETFDLVFIDAGKLDYPLHYELALGKTRRGGFLLADNVLWDGKVAAGDEKDETSRVLRTFNNMVYADERVENILLPLRDGLMVMRKV
ncbi:MAG: O-methyltransferase [Saprospiraceae bacterium]|nr:O-methyltransferase [Saprospiraceae bacterium]